LDKRVEKIIAMMREDVRGELSLSEFAQSVNLSVWRLCHIFKSDVGMPPIRYLRLLRMERAKDLLESSFLSVKEIAYQVGLNDESHFVRDFKSTYGFSPALYRTHFKNSHTDPHNGNNGKNGSNGTKPNNVQQELVRAAKSSLLPSIHLVVCMVSYLTWPWAMDHACAILKFNFKRSKIRQRTTKTAKHESLLLENWERNLSHDSATAHSKVFSIN
jgi:AraC-like DNA-binding protein